MSFTLNDAATLAKQLIREEVTDTISTARMETYIILTYYDWCRELQWPEGTFAATTANDPTTNKTAQEYQLPENINLVFRVYLNGQRCGETSIPILEGDVIQAYNPNWRVLPSITVPALTTQVQLAIPITAGPSFAQLQYYLRGGFLGFVPGPSVNGYPISIEGCVIPPTPADSDTILLPPQFKHGLAYGAIYRFLLGDRRVQEAKAWKDLEQEQWQMAMRWRRRMGGIDQLPAAIPPGYRTWYGRGQVGLQLPTVASQV